MKFLRVARPNNVLLLRSAESGTDVCFDGDDLCDRVTSVATRNYGLSMEKSRAASCLLPVHYKLAFTYFSFDFTRQDLARVL